MTTVVEVKFDLTQKPADYKPNTLIASDSNRRIPMTEEVRNFLYNTMNEERPVQFSISKEEDHYRLTHVGPYRSIEHDVLRDTRMQGRIKDIHYVHVEDITRFSE